MLNSNVLRVSEDLLPDCSAGSGHGVESETLVQRMQRIDAAADAAAVDAGAAQDESLHTRALAKVDKLVSTEGCIRSKLLNLLRELLVERRAYHHRLNGEYYAAEVRAAAALRAFVK